LPKGSWIAEGKTEGFINAPKNRKNSGWL